MRYFSFEKLTAAVKGVSLLLYGIQLGAAVKGFSLFIPCTVLFGILPGAVVKGFSYPLYCTVWYTTRAVVKGVSLFIPCTVLCGILLWAILRVFLCLTTVQYTTRGCTEGCFIVYLLCGILLEAYHNWREGYVHKLITLQKVS